MNVNQRQADGDPSTAADASGAAGSGAWENTALSDASYVVPHVTLDELFYRQGAFACPALIKLDIEVRRALGCAHGAAFIQFLSHAPWSARSVGHPRHFT